tara:strand:+ start:2379 stop:3950 length:1572 start_codon:yes stop_codon:yes gene_type:complete
LKTRYDYDVLVLGSGAAGMSIALNLPRNLKIAIVSKSDLSEGATYWAQGGMAAALHADDSIASHIADTIAAGGELCDPDVVRHVAKNASEVVNWLLDLGVPFDKRNPTPTSELHLTMEGGHSHRRIVHATDQTGRAISNVLGDKLRDSSNIDIFTNRVAVDLLIEEGISSGAYILNKDNGLVEVFQARCTVLATGGASKVYLYTSNPDGASGDGIAMAWRAGCRVANLEFNQFHPTCLFHAKAKSFLISEAIRGEGGILRLPNGNAFMHQFHPDKELAPRDVVARAIDHEMKRLGIEYVFLDISHRGEEFLRKHFPTIFKKCLEFGIDISREPIPVVPAAHYTCGGVMINKEGQTDIPNLYAIGEASFTGLHGANRMASNSLLECFVYANHSANNIASKIKDISKPTPAAAWDATRVTHSNEDVVISHNWEELRRFMWDYVGIVRSDKRLYRALHRVELLKTEISEYYGNYKIGENLIELRNLAVVAELMIRCAIKRKESRGLHFNLDHPNQVEQAKNTILCP